jgi:hypothetical protein
MNDATDRNMLQAKRMQKFKRRNDREDIMAPFLVLFVGVVSVMVMVMMVMLAMLRPAASSHQQKKKRYVMLIMCAVRCKTGRVG